MDTGTASHLAMLFQQREELATQRRRIERAHCLAVLDHIAASIRRNCPEAVYVNFAYYGNSRTLDLLGVLGGQPSPLGAYPWLWGGRDERHPLAELADQIERDVQTALAPTHSLAWAMVRRDGVSDGNSWLLELPPPDRAARIAQLVREYHPEATALIVDGRPSGGRIIEVVEGISDDGTENRTRRRWTPECEEILRRLVAQIFAVPALDERHLMPIDDLYTHPYDSTPGHLVRLMRLPPVA
ncbi:hypothetical protein ACFV2X_11430 [Streptomyces sp. NPDC059679]|uniref:hypothetical protein n=1 Tax=Streptomyces sp. NPDC059679 TaxID=3346903 RepID=UPI0036A266D2